MRKNPYFINVLHGAFVGIICLIRLLLEAFSPAVVLPRIDIPFLVILSVIPMTLEYYLVSERNREPFLSIILAGETVALLPYCGGWSINMPIWKLFFAGAAVFGITDLFYAGIGERMSSCPNSKISPAVNAFILFLASQCFQGLL